MTRGTNRRNERKLVLLGSIVALSCASCGQATRSGAGANPPAPLPDAARADARLPSDGPTAFVDGESMGGRGDVNPGDTRPSDARAGDGSSTPPSDAVPPPGQALAARYPGDKGIDKDPAVVWYEGFEAASVSAVTSRYDVARPAGMALVPDVPTASPGKTSMRMRASRDMNATDLYKALSRGEDELFVRYYVKYQALGAWHHSGLWIAGYNPASRFPSPMAGLRPSGSDRFHVAVEPNENGKPSPRLDFYNYWMKMHSWMDQPMGNAAYYGNSVAHMESFRVDDDQWMCLEVHLKLNPSGSSAAGAELGVWKNDALVRHYDERGPRGYWVKDKFCPLDADSDTCVRYKPASPDLQVLDQQYRSTTDLKITGLWPQNYITMGPAADVWFDDIVAARTRVGCIR